MKPVIAITCKRRSCVQNYIDAIKQFGGEPWVISSLECSIPENPTLISKYIEKLDGLLLPGGGDIDPCHYFQTRDKFVKWNDTVISKKVNQGISRSRDALELRLYQKVLETEKPVFGICRGIQIMNVVMGGNLYQHLSMQIKDPLPHKDYIGKEDKEHVIEIDRKSRLNQIASTEQILVNSSHHQAVNLIGDGLVVTAHSDDGIIEAIEIPSRRFVIGVQYHPERMLKNPLLSWHAEKLFKEFINAASAIIHMPN